MTTLRTAAQQALDALKMMRDEYEEYACPACDHADAAIYALKAALAEPLQEPVAWMDREGDLYKMPEIEGWAPPHTMLYTAPPQRKPLTEEEIRDLWSWAMTAEAERTATTQQHAFARAIERAHGIGVQDEP